jgi:hypothetical protein
MNKQIKNKNWMVCYHSESNCFTNICENNNYLDLEIIKDGLSEEDAEKLSKKYNQNIKINHNPEFEIAWYKDFTKFRVFLGNITEHQTKILKSYGDIKFYDLILYKQSSIKNLNEIQKMFDDFIADYKKNYSNTINYIKRTNNL